MKCVKYENGIAVRENGRLVIIEGKECLLQRLKHRLLLVQGEVSYEPRSGVPWIQIFQQRADSDRVRFEIERELKKDPEVSTVRYVELLENDRVTRKQGVHFSVNSIYGVAEGVI